ncbi:DNA polymerase III, subunits gamma and tau (plasmid) [Stanieria cyanosphaera PCC 7437]|uniref:DNA polymerase III subunit gamma/tau n=1 Tax=Stanieria cyanosphaera (strain ATCC 29371 / PCC 7437) TaxID=111780 RepID=K9Y206_STAC7|nr:DNA polymerase III subunit gamma/tau [Stanieria cyanosphaera]AFZ38022.1 DNA polymerase III, subunits gamma and tau [Stanieria cyanosphaera PCC 7437]
MKSLPLKYRPQQLEDLIGQEFIKTTLKNALSAKKIAPAYLFSGPRGTGKTSTARILAKSLNCLAVEQPTIKPCGECSSCRSIERSNAIDVTEIDAASHNGVDNARELIELSHLAPAQVRYKVFILDESQMLTSAAQNTLLKLLEEPPERTIFILCTTELHKILPTIVSRCQLFNFKSLSQTAVIDYLSQIATTEEIDLTPEAIAAISKSGLGSLRDSLQLLSQLQVLRQQITLDNVIEAVGGISSQQMWKLMTNLVKEDVLNVLLIARNLIQMGKSPQLILQDLLNCHRDLLLVKATQKDGKSLLSSNLEYSKLDQLASKISWHHIERNLEQLQKREQQLRFSINNAVWLETCLLNMMDSTSINETQTLLNNRQHRTKTQKSTANLGQLWAKIVNSTELSNQKMLSHASLIDLDRELNFAVLAVESKYVAKFQKNVTHLSRIITHSLRQQQPIKVIIEEQQ